MDEAFRPGKPYPPLRCIGKRALEDCLYIHRVVDQFDRLGIRQRRRHKLKITRSLQKLGGETVLLYREPMSGRERQVIVIGVEKGTHEDRHSATSSQHSAAESLARA